MTRCNLCPRHCRLDEGQNGFCRARVCRGGRVLPKGYGKLTSLALDPIEKKPLARFCPGSRILSVGGFGCNMSCFFCQNAGISFCGEEDAPLRRMAPEELVSLADSLKPGGNIGLAFTYNEPLLNPEFVSDCADLLRPRGLKTVLVTNGCFCLDALGGLLAKTDALNVDLKGFTPAWYRRLGGDLETVKAFISAAAAVTHVEVTTLVVPGENDGADEIAALSAWLASLRPDIPLHLSRFFPRHKAQAYPATDPGTLKRLAQIARESLQYVYLGNL